MGKLKEMWVKIQNIPEFSEKNYSIVGYVLAALMTITGAYLIYNVLFSEAFVFNANWNMFKSPLGNLCWIIGFLWAIVWWGKFVHWSQIPIIEKRDKYGNLIERKENMDVIEQMFAKVALPFIGHFIIEPLMYGAIIFYPIQCIIAVVGAVFPYIFSFIILAIVVGAWLFTRTFHFRYHSVVLVMSGLLFVIAFAWGGYAISVSETGGSVQVLKDKTLASDALNQETITKKTDNDEFVEVVEGEEEQEQFDGVGKEGLYGSLPYGQTEYIGEMSGFPIEFIITKGNDSVGDVKAVYKNVKYGTVMNLEGESLPGQCGDISFYGKHGNMEWLFNLTGGASKITGTAQGEGKEFVITLYKNN